LLGSHPSFQAILEAMTEWTVPRLQPADTITCVCDRNEPAAGEARQRFEFLRKSRGTGSASIPALPSHRCGMELCLQAADVLVYDKCRWMQTWVRPQQ